MEDLHVRDKRGLEAVKGVSLSVRGGEVVAIAGVDGNGQLELVQAIAGVRGRSRGACRRRRDVTGRGVRATTEAGVAHIPEDRQLCGLVLDFTLAENLALREYRSPPISNHGLLSIGEMNDRARAAAEGVRRARRRARARSRARCPEATSRRSRWRARSPATPSS